MLCIKTEQIRWSLYAKLASIIWKIKNHSGNWVLGRYACLGQEIIESFQLKTPIYNIQKGRTDLLMDIIENKRKSPKTGQVSEYMLRKDIIPLIGRQQNISWTKWDPPAFLFMDSFAELTDQKFIHQKGDWAFCSHYSDIDHHSDFGTIFECAGLLNEHELFEEYFRFFSFIRKTYGNIPIIFLHFPAILDKRDVFHERYKHIEDSINKVKKIFPPFHAISIEENIVDWHESEKEDKKFPYHFNKATYDKFKETIMENNFLKYEEV